MLFKDLDFYSAYISSIQLKKQQSFLLSGAKLLLLTCHVRPFVVSRWNLARLLCITFMLQSFSLCGPAEVCREYEFGGRRPEQAVPPRENTFPALRPSRLEPQRLDGPPSGGVRLLLQ